MLFVGVIGEHGFGKVVGVAQEVVERGGSDGEGLFASDAGDKVCEEQGEALLAEVLYGGRHLLDSADALGGEEDIVVMLVVAEDD